MKKRKYRLNKKKFFDFCEIVLFCIAWFLFSVWFFNQLFDRIIALYS